MLNNAATKWIKYELQNGTWVSIVTFTTDATLQTDFIQIEDEQSREDIASFVPSTAYGGTCICNGMDLALKVRHCNFFHFDTLRYLLVQGMAERRD